MQMVLLMEIKHVEASAGSSKEVEFVLRVASLVHMALVIKLLEVEWIRMLQIWS